MEKTKARLDDARERHKVRGGFILSATEFNAQSTPAACDGCFRTRETLQGTHPYAVNILSSAFQLSYQYDSLFFAICVIVFFSINRAIELSRPGRTC